MHTPLAPLLSALLTFAAPPPPQATPVRSPGDATVEQVGGKTFKQWIDDLKSPDASTREEAIRALVLFGQDTPKAVPELVKRLRDPDSSPRVRACIALSMIEIRKDDLPKVVQELGIRLQEDSQAIVRYYAATTLNGFGEDARGALAGLVKGVTDPSTWEIRHACVLALRSAGHDTNQAPYATAERALLQAIKDPTYHVRLEAIMTIGALGRPADPVLYAAVKNGLEERTNDRDLTVRIWSYASLMSLEDVASEKWLKALIKHLTDKEAKVKVNAARGLGALGTKAKAAVPALLDTLGDKDVRVVAAAAWALTQMEGLSGSSRATLLAQLKNQDSNVRAAVAQAFGSAGIKGRTAVPALTDLLLDKEQPPFTLASACWALGEIADPDARAQAALTAICDRKDADESLKQEAQIALDKIHKLKK